MLQLHQNDAGTSCLDAIDFRCSSAAPFLRRLLANAAILRDLDVPLRNLDWRRPYQK
jgi:hypothetical protein